VAVTRGPGIGICLDVGLAKAKALVWVLFLFFSSFFLLFFLSFLLSFQSFLLFMY
jgi:hypothetical protein